MFSVTKVHSYIGNYSVRQTASVRRAHIRPQQPMKAFHVFSKAVFSIFTLFAPNKIKLSTVRSLSAQRTINSKEELKQAIEKGNFEKVDQDLGTKGKLKMEEKNVLKDAYDLMITIYEQKNIKEKIDAYTAKFNNVDKDH